MASFESFYSFTALPNWIFKKQLETEGGWLTHTELSVLLVLQFIASSKDLQATYSTICLCANISKGTAACTIQQLKEKGLIECVKQISNGAISTVYHLRLWGEDIEPRQALTPVTFEQAVAQKDNQSSKRFVARPEIIPIKLQEAASVICDFFNNHKGGAKTQTAFEGLLSNLTKIASDPGGGIDAVKGQLQEAIDRSRAGEKKWHSVTYLNWERFGKKAKPLAWGQQLQGSARPSTVALVSKFEGDEAAELDL